MNNTLLSNNLAKSVESKLERLSQLTKDVEEELCELILSLVGENTPMTFNDETGFVEYNDEEYGYIYIYGVRVVNNEGLAIEFNCNTSDDNEYGLNEDGWFDANFHGTYKYTELFECITAWMEKEGK